MAPLSEEEENYVRLALLLKGVTPRAVRTYFDREFPPATLPSTLSTSHNTLLDLKAKRIINQVQWNLLKNGVSDSKSFDVTLMICLIRNLTSINPPINGFESLPLPGETTPGPDLARIKCYRNKLAHHDSNTIDTVYFNTAWRDISDAVSRLGGQTMYQECQQLKGKILDTSNQEIILEIQQTLEEMRELRKNMDDLGMDNSKVKENLRELKAEHSNVTENLRELRGSHGTLQAEHSNVTENLRELRDSHNTLQAKHSNVTENLRELRDSYNTLQAEHSNVTENLRELRDSHSTIQAEHLMFTENQREPIPSNIKEQMENDIKDWEKKDEMFVTTRASDYVMKCLKENSCLTLTGPSGVGKSFIARHTALVLQKEGYNIVPVRKPDDIGDYYQPGKQTVFIVDDICGNFIANQQQIENWKQLLPVINKIIADTFCKIIVSCRLQVYKDDKFNILVPFKSCECNLLSNKLCLTSVEKNSLSKTYIGLSLGDIDNLSQKIEFFPLLCSLYDGEKHGDVKDFFKNPFIVYKNELDNLKRHGDEGNYRICSLALLVLFNNKLKDKWFQGKVTDEQRHIMEDTCGACRLNRSTSKTEVEEALNTLDGTFVYKQDGIYKTLHGKLFDFLAHYFGQKMIECLIDHGDSDLVHERFMWRKLLDDKNGQIDFIIEIPEDYLEAYFKRFIKDWSTGLVGVVLCVNKNMTVSIFRQQLLQKLNQLDKSLQVTLASTKDTVLPKGHPTKGTTALILTCFEGYTDMVQWMLYNDVDVDQIRDDGVTGLFMACHRGHTDIVRLLLEKNANVDLCSNDGCSSLFMASQEGHTDIVRLLLEMNPNVDLCNDKRRSPLFVASQEGNNDIVRLLLEKNPNVDQRDKFGCTPLRQASVNGHTAIVRLLIAKNANIDRCDNTYGCSPLFMACQQGHADTIRLLLERNADVDLCDSIGGCSPLNVASQKGYTDIVKLLLGSNSNVNLCSKNGCSPLYMASQQGHTDIVKLLLQRITNIDLCDSNGCSPLNMASEYGHADIVKLLLERNPNVDLCDDILGCSSLNMASEKGYTDIVKLLLEKNPNIDLCRSNGCSPLYMASQQNHTEIVKLLLERNPNVYLCDTFGYSPLFKAIQNGHTNIVRLLLEGTHNIDLCDYNGCSLLNMASEHGHTEIVKLILKRNPNVDMCNNNGCSPLLVASHNGHTDIVKLLLERKSNINLCISSGYSPLCMAYEKGHTEIVKLLLESNPNNIQCEWYGWYHL